jgi:thioesterase domain-containing protein/acyl carrier protein
MENSFGLSEYAWISGYKHLIGQPISFDAVPLGYAYEPEHFLLLGETSEPVGPNEVGEIAIRSPFTIHGYRKDPERSALVLRKLSPEDKDLTFFTGDYAFTDEQGLIRTSGRADEQVKIRGYNVRPTEVEAILSQMDGIRETPVVSFVAPNGIRRLACHYIAESKFEISSAGLREYLRTRVPGYMVPGHFLAHGEFPRTRTGKVDRKGLLDPLAIAASQHEKKEELRTASQRLLADIWKDVLGRSDFGQDDDFFDIGGDSLQAMAVVIAIEQRFQTRLPLETLILDGATIRRLAERIGDTNEQAGQGLRKLNRGGPLAPIFAMPVIGGHLSDYLALAHALEGHHSLEGLSFDGGPTDNPSSRRSVGELAKMALAVLSVDERSGPVALMGYSYGGIIAFEAASQLARQQIPVSLIIIDSVPVWLDRLRHLRTAWQAARRGNLAIGQRRLVEFFGGPVRMRPTPRSVEEAYLSAVHDFTPEPVEGVQALLVLSAENPAKADLVGEWQRLLGAGLIIAEVDGNHFTMMRDPNVAGLARKVRDWLERR